MRSNNIRKGSYHQYCRNRFQSQSAHQPQRNRLTKIVRGENQKVQDFQNFQTYLMFLQQKEQTERDRRQSQTERNYRTAGQTSRPKTQIVRRKIELDQSGQQNEKKDQIKPFFPFYKCKIESSYSPSRDGKFRISNKRFKLNYKIIEENMGKADEMFYF